MHRGVDLHTCRLLIFSTRLGKIVHGTEVALSDCAKVANLDRAEIVDPDRAKVTDPDQVQNLRSDAKIAMRLDAKVARSEYTQPSKHLQEYQNLNP
jgi:hypothetical protein